MKENYRPIISICIPTYNRQYSLQYTLKSIIEQELLESWDVEIVITDNASTDGTEEYINKLCKRYSNIKYFRNDVNIWGPANINKVLSLWKWEYLWLFWSDDIMLTWWLKITLNIIKNSCPDLILHKNSLCPNCRQLNRNSSGWNFVFKSQKDYFNYLWDWYNLDKHSFMHIENLQTFMSLICIRKSYYEKCLDSIENDKIWKNKFNTFYFSQNLVTHFCEVSSSITLLSKCYVSELTKSDDDNVKKSWYKYTKEIANDAKLLYKFYYDKYKLNDNFKKLERRSSQYRNLCIIYGFLWNLFWMKFVKFFSKIYHKVLW